MWRPGGCEFGEVGGPAVPLNLVICWMFFIFFGNYIGRCTPCIYININPSINDYICNTHVWLYNLKISIVSLFLFHWSLDCSKKGLNESGIWKVNGPNPSLGKFAEQKLLAPQETFQGVVNWHFRFQLTIFHAKIPLKTPHENPWERYPSKMMGFSYIYVTGW